MTRSSYPVDVISICSAEGVIRPLRLRLQDDEEQIRMNITEVVGVKRIPYVGVEADLFLCRGRVGDAEWMVELKYSIRSHSWTILRRIY